MNVNFLHFWLSACSSCKSPSTYQNFVNMPKQCWLICFPPTLYHITWISLCCILGVVFLTDSDTLGYWSHVCTLWVPLSSPVFCTQTVPSGTLGTNPFFTWVLAESGPTLKNTPGKILRYYIKGYEWNDLLKTLMCPKGCKIKNAQGKLV